MELSRLHNKDALVEIITQNLNSHLENLPDDLERKGNGASIYRIPDHIKKVHPKAFKPKRVSFGPYHHGELHLSPMEKMKHLALRYFERRCGLCVEDIVNELWDMLEDLQRSYDKLDDEWKKKPTKFLEVMILDGCLMMQVLLEDTDVSKFTTTDVLRDMLLLENQLPMKLLDKLYLMSMPEHNKACLFLLLLSSSNSSSLREQILFSLGFSFVEDCWEGVLPWWEVGGSSTLANLGNERRFMSKDYIYISMRPFVETKSKAMRVSCGS